MTKPDKKQMKSAARLYAVQALFQMETSGQTVEAVVRGSKPTVSALSMTATRWPRAM